MSEPGPRINPRTRLLAVDRGVEGWLIAGTDIGISRPRWDGHPWTFFAEYRAGDQWLRERDLHTFTFDRYQDALRALTALHAADPLPAAEHGRLPRLRRDPQQPVWYSDCGRYTVRRGHDSLYAVARVGSLPASWHYTLRMARRDIARRSIAERAFDA